MAPRVVKRPLLTTPELKLNHCQCAAPCHGWLPMAKLTLLTLWPMKMVSNQKELIYQNKSNSNWAPLKAVPKSLQFLLLYSILSYLFNSYFFIPLFVWFHFDRNIILITVIIILFILLFPFNNNLKANKNANKVISKMLAWLISYAHSIGKAFDLRSSPQIPM